MLAWVLKTGLPGLSVIGFNLLFIRAFVKAFAKKREIPWLTWLIPYFVGVVMGIWLFVLGNPVSFVFRDFYLSLPTWLTEMNRFGRVMVLAVVLYIVAYLSSKNLSKVSNTSVALSVFSIVTGMVAIFFNEFAALGMIFLFVLSIFLNSVYENRKGTESTSRLFKWLSFFAVASFAMGILIFSNPLIPLKNVLTPNATTVTATNTVNGRQLATNGTAGTIHEAGGGIRPDLTFPGWFYDLLIYSLGSVVIAVAAIGMVFMFFNRSKKKRRIRNSFKYLWLFLSALFLSLIVMYSFGLLKPTGTFQSAGVSGAANAHGNSRIFPTIPASISKISAAHGQPGGMSVIFVILVVAVISVSIFFGFREFFKYAFIGAEEKKKSEDPSGADDEKPEENRDFTGTPRQTVLFYYGLLRGRIGNPSSTPYEFREELEKFIGDRAGRLTEIFVKLRYRGIEISEEEANIVKKEVSKLIG